MPYYKTKYGTHYHENPSCSAISGHDVETVGSTEGLSPCALCCGASGKGGLGGSSSSMGGVASGIPSDGTTSFSADMTGSDGDVDGVGFDGKVAEGQDVRVTTVDILRYEATDDYVMKLADSLLAIKAGMDATRDGQYVPDAMPIESESMREVLEAIPQPSVGSSAMPECDISPEDIAGTMRTPREAFEAQRQDEFMDDFRRRTVELIKRWDEDEWQEWREAREDLAQYMKGNLRRERAPQYSMFIDEEVESLLRQRYEAAVPCPSWALASQWQRYGRLLTGHEDRWPGYAEAKQRWDKDSELIWQQMQLRRKARERQRGKSKPVSVT